VNGAPFPFDSTSRCVELRRSFDHAFAQPVVIATATLVDLLAVRVGGDPYALRLSDIAGLQVNLHVVPLPGPAPHLLGIAAIRDVMAPIYDLAGLLGYPPPPSCRWIAMVRTSTPVGLAIERFEAHLRVADTFVSIKASENGIALNRLARDAVQAGGVLRPILQVTDLVRSLEETP
jgi:chemotaxis signal transduction protein